jgi:hypothetical protein
MKKIAACLLIVVLITTAFKPVGGVEGKMFPTMLCENYNGKKVTLPAETKGKYTLLGMAFSNGAEDDLKTWINPIYN